MHAQLSAVVAVEVALVTMGLGKHTRPGAVKRMTNYTAQIGNIPLSQSKSKMLSRIEMSMAFHLSLSLSLSLSVSLR